MLIWYWDSHFGDWMTRLIALQLFPGGMEDRKVTPKPMGQLLFYLYLEGGAEWGAGLDSVALWALYPLSP